MLPLQAIAAGLILMLFDLKVGDPQVDLVPDPAGWAAMFYGAGRLPARFPRRPTLLGLAATTGVISVFLWIPGVDASLSSDNPLLAWALGLPACGFAALLALAMMELAAAGLDHSARGWWKAVLVGTGLTVIMPTIVHGVGEPALVVPAVAIALGTIITCIVLCFRHTRRPWVDGPTVLTTG